jgi:acyl-coenzyme A thioesterase PaaI-like protein
MTDVPMQSTSLLNRMNVTASRVDGQLVMRATPVPETSRLGSIRVSVLSYVVDALAGIGVDSDPEAWTFTSDMTLRMRPAGGAAYIEGRATTLRGGRRSATCEVHLVDDTGAPALYSVLGFTRVTRRPGDPQKLEFDADAAAKVWGAAPPIDVPLRDAAGIQVIDGPAGVVEVELVPDLLNPAGALQGAMVALVAESAAEEATSARRGEPTRICDLDVRYLHQARVGPIRTETEWLGDGPDAAILVRLIDTSTGQLLTHAIARAES